MPASAYRRDRPVLTVPKANPERTSSSRAKAA